MKIKWRTYEIMLVTILALTKVTGYIIWYYTTPYEYLYATFADFFQRKGEFNYVFDILIPQISSVLLFYVPYLVINFFTIPLLLKLSKKKPINYALSLGEFLLIALLIAYVGNIISQNTGLITHGDYFRLLTVFADTFPQSYRTCFIISLTVVTIYIAYAIIRERLIDKIQKSGSKRAYFVFIFNRIALILVIYFSIPAIAQALQVKDYRAYYNNIYLTFITPALLCYSANYYGIYPYSPKAFFNFQSIGLLILSTFFFTVLGFEIFTDIGFHRGDWWLLCWGIQLFFITPLSWILYRQFKNKTLQRKLVETELAKSKADLQFLRSQINPHFLFNALNTIYGNALSERATLTADSIQKLGDMMSYVLYDNQQDFTSVINEIEYIRNYIFLQKSRMPMSSNMTIEEDIRDDDCHHLIPPLLLIPFVENAFKHGVRVTEKSWIKIKFRCDTHNILFEVHNSFHKDTVVDPEKERSGIGLTNVIRRLEIYYKDRYDLKYGPQDNEYVITLLIQFF